MLLKKTSQLFALTSLFLLVFLVSSLQAQVAPDRSGVGQAEFRAAELNIETRYRTPNELPAEAMANAAADLAALGVRSDAGFVETRGGGWANLMMSRPLLPGRGNGNNLSWANLGRNAPKNDTELSHAASQAFTKYIEANSHQLRIDTYELSNPGKVTVNRGGAMIQIYLPRVYNGIPVRGSYLSASINNGNLVLFGTEKWGDINTSTTPGISQSDARQAVQALVEPYQANGSWGKTELVMVPVAVGQNPNNIPIGQGLDHRLAWVIRPSFDGDMRHFEALVDAHTGELLSFEDTNQYAEVKGGVLPVTNDGIAPDGVEQAGWPMPFADVGAETTDTGGNFTNNGTVTTDFFGPYVNINDQCGTSSLTDSVVLDWGTSGGTDCTTPGFGGAGNTHASRTGFYELNKMIEMARGQLPGNNWLQSRLISNMNINNTCNAFWNGQVNFYRSGGGCFNTGEIAGVFDHEWGHGMDANDATPGIASPSGEGIADIYTALRLDTSCIGRNFRATACTGFGDPCVDEAPPGDRLACTGVRDIDYLMRASRQPHDWNWSINNCGGSVHCVGAVYAEAVWSLWKRELQGPPYNYDNNTAHEIVNRMTFIGAGNTGTWFSGDPMLGFGGCAGSSGYMNFLAADDDNGNLNDGTPHMTAIFNAFNDQEIACAAPTVQDSGCANNPATAPVVTASALDKSVSLSWGAVADANSYEVFRTEGVFACDFGKVKVAETAGLSFSDSGLQNGRDYSYVVIPKGSADACFGPASSCTTAKPLSGPNVDIDPGSAVLAITTGDGDAFLDNGENGMLTFDVNNTGAGSLTNVRLTGVSVVSPAGTTVSTLFPAAVSPSTLAEGATGSGSFNFTAGGLSFNDVLVFEVSFTADEMTVTKTGTLTVDNTQSDLLSCSSKTWDFETDLDGWTLIQGTFNQTTTSGGANGTAGYVASSAFLDNQCDQVRSPAFRLTASSTLSLWNNYEIENFSGQWWDRANIAFFEDGARNSVDPDGGRLYNASGAGATCVTVGQNGWANVNGTWGTSSWSASALGSAGRAGQVVHLDVAYGTDVSVNGKGFWFDEVTVTDIEILVAQGGSDPDCGGVPNEPPVVTIDAPADGSSFNQGVSVTFTGTAIDPEDDDISANLSWTSSIDGFIDSGASISTSILSLGVHTITADVTDSNSAPGTDQITVTINAAPATTFHVLTIETGTLAAAKGRKYGTAAVTLVDDQGNTVGTGYTVSGDFSGSIPETGVPDETDSNGVAEFVTSGTAKKNVEIFFCVSGVTDGPLTYNPAANTPGTTCDQLPPLGDDVYVQSVNTGTQGIGGGRKVGAATVTLVDENGTPVPDHTVTGNFSGDITESGVTSTSSSDAAGSVTVLSTVSDKGKVNVSFCVTAVTGLLTYVPGVGACTN